MGCVDENTAVDLIDGRLGPDAASRVHEHVADCGDCRRLIAELARAPTAAFALAATAAAGGRAAEMTDAASPAAKARRASTASPERIGRYRVQGRLGQGGMGAVYAAEDPELHRRVAIKLLHSGQPDGTERLLREARAMAKLRHPNVITVYEVGRDSDDVFIAMELIDGVSLREWLEGDRHWRDRLAMMIQAGNGLAAAHEEGLVHRDFKPDNVMVGRDGRAQVLDFGLAKAARAPELPSRSGAPGPVLDLTQSGTLVGTPAYMAPEQFSLAPTDERTDQFAFCVALFEALHGVRPFAGKTVEALGDAVTTGQVIEVPTNSEVPEPIAAAIRRGLAVDPADRFPTMRELLAALEVGERPRRKVWPALVATLIVVGVALGLVGWLLESGAPSESANANNPYAEIFAGSDLPETLAEPVPGDPLDVTVHRLSNGLTVYISPNPQKPRISTQLIVRAGSRDNPDTVGGLAHMVEHMMFKGTERLGTTDFQAESVHLDRLRNLYRKLAAADSEAERHRLLARIDAETVAAARYVIPEEFTGTASLLGFEGINGRTDRDATSFVADVPSHRFALWARLEAERWSSPVFRLFHTEMGTIFNEKRRRETAGVSSRTLSRALFAEVFPGHPYGRPAIGSYEDILSEPFINLERFFATWYVPNNAALLLAGDIEPEQAIAVLERELSRWKPKPIPERTRALAPPLTKPVTRSITSETERLIVVAWRAAAAGDANEAAVTVMGELVSDANGIAGAGSVLRIRAWYQPLLEGGMWAIIAVPHPDQPLDEALAVIDGVVASLKAGTIEAATVDAVIENYRAALARTFEDNASRLVYIARSYRRHQRWPDAAGWEAQIAAIDRDDIARVAKRYLNRDRVVIRVEPGIAEPVAVPEPPAITPLVFATAKGDADAARSELARQLLSAEAVELPLRFVWRGRDYHLRETRSGPVIAVENRESDLFAMELRWSVGSRSIPLVCAALRALEDAGDGGLSADARKRRWYRQVMDVSTRCGPDSIQIKMSGVDRNFDASSSELWRWLGGGGLTDEVWAQASAAYVAEREQRRGRDSGLVFAVDQLASRGAASDYLAGPGREVIMGADAAAARRALRELGETRHFTLYFGPRDVNTVRAEPKSALAAPPEAPPRRYLRPSRPRITLLDTGSGQTIEVMIRVPLGPIAETQVAVAQTFSNYLGSGIAGRLPEAMREAAGLSYAVFSEIAIPPRAGDDASLVVRFSTHTTLAQNAIERALAIVRDPEIARRDFKRAKRRTEKAYRSHWIGPRDLPGMVAQWRRRGLDADPRPARFTRLESIGPSDLSDFAAALAAAPVIISIAGNTGSLDGDWLERLGEVKTVTRRDLFVH